MHSRTSRLFARCVGLAGLAVLGLATSSPLFSPRVEAAQADVQRYGEKIGEPFESGFLFIDGTYIEAPYRVDRRGLSVYINGHLISKRSLPSDWRTSNDPGAPPAGALVFTPPEKGKPDPNSYWNRKWRYLNTVSGQEEAKERMLEALRSAPDVAQIRPDARFSSRRFLVVDKQGKTRTLWLDEGSHPGNLIVPVAPVKPDEEISRSIEVSRQLYEDALRIGQALFLGEGEGYLAGKHVVDALDAILNSSGEAEKNEKLKTAGLSPNPMWEGALRNIRYSPQLRERYEKIVTELQIHRNAAQEREKGRARDLEKKMEGERLTRSVDVGDFVKEIPPAIPRREFAASQPQGRTEKPAARVPEAIVVERSSWGRTIVLVSAALVVAAAVAIFLVKRKRDGVPPIEGR